MARAAAAGSAAAAMGRPMTRMSEPDAMAAGTDLLIIGRPVTAAADPAAAVRAIAEELRLVAAS